MGTAAEDAKRYLQHKQVPQLFESLMTGVMYNKPSDPVEFLQRALGKITSEPDKRVTWDMFIDNPPSAMDGSPTVYHTLGAANEVEARTTPPAGTTPTPAGTPVMKSGNSTRVSSVVLNSRTAAIPQTPIIIMMGGPGGGRNRHAERAAEHFQDDGLVHISMPKLIKDAVTKYKWKHQEWTNASKNYDNGESIPNELALALVKSAMNAEPEAHGFLVEGYPRDMAQIRDLENEVKRVDVVLMLDFDEEALREHMKTRRLENEVIQQRLKDFKHKTLPAAKYFDDKLLLRLIPGEKDDDVIFGEIKHHIELALKGKSAEQKSEDHEETTIEVPTSLAPVEARSEEAVSPEADTPPPGLPNNSPVILVLGAPGSLKQEYCKRIVKRYDGFVHISMGELLRSEMAAQSQDVRWQNALEKMKNGELVPTELCRQLIYKTIHTNPKSWGFVIEGYPRTAEQASDFEKKVDRIDLVLLIDCTEPFCLNVLRTRSEMEGADRVDDTPTGVKQRLGQFKALTLPMLKYFDEKGKLKVVEGDKGVDEIFQEVLNIIDTALFIPQDTGENGSGKSLDSSNGKS